MFSPATKTSKNVNVVPQKTAGTSFFRKAGDVSFFGSSFFGSQVQPKLKVIGPHNLHDIEADAVAKDAKHIPETAQAPPRLSLIHI